MNEVQERPITIHDRLDLLAKLIGSTAITLERALRSVTGEQVPSEPYDAAIGVHGRLQWIIDRGHRNVALVERLAELLGDDPSESPRAMPADGDMRDVRADYVR